MIKFLRVCSIKVVLMVTVSYSSSDCSSCHILVVKFDFVIIFSKNNKYSYIQSSKATSTTKANIFSFFKILVQTLLLITTIRVLI